MKKQFLLLLIIISLCATARTSARGIMDYYNFSHLTIEQGVPDNFVDDIYKDSKGFLWLATSNGLSRYDGYEFVHYNTSSGAIRLKSNFIKQTCEDNFNRLWIVSEGGIDMLDLTTNTLVAQDQLKEMADEESTHVFKDGKGNIWVVFQEDVCKITFDQWGAIKGTSSLSLPDRRKELPITAINEINNEIWIGYNRAVYKVVDKGNQLTLHPALAHAGFGANNNVSCMLQHQNKIWIGTDRGLYCHDSQSATHRRYRHDEANPYSLSQSFIMDLAVGPMGEIVVATLKGLNFYNPTSDNFTRLLQTDNKVVNGLNCNFINSLLTDNSTLWIGTEMGGLNKMNKQNLALHTYTHNKDNKKSLAPNPVNSIYEDRSGNLWVGNMEGGLNLKKKQSNDFIHFMFSPSNPYSISHNAISAITEDNNKQLWVGTWGMGVNVLDLKNISAASRFTRYTADNTATMNSNFIGALCFDSINNGMWIGTLNGLCFYDLEKKNMELVPLSSNRFYNNTMSGMCMDKKARLWVCTAKGLLLIDLLSFAKNHSDFIYSFKGNKLDSPASGHIEKLNCVYQDSQGTIWLGSHGYGLYQLVSETNGKFVFKSLTTKDGLSNNNVLGILEDDNHNLWLSTNYGISCFNPRHKTFRNFSVADGILENQFYWSASYKSPSKGTLYFGNLAGLIGIEGIHNTTLQEPTDVVLTKLTVLNEVIYQGSNKYAKQYITYAKELSLHEKDKSFSIEFSALDFNNTKAYKYAYRLKGFDDRWTETEGAQRIASYTNLNAGNYIFQVKALYNNSINQSRVTELFISIKPFFYKTWWFYTLILLVLVVSIVAAYLWRVSTLQKQKMILTKKVQSRTRELENKTIELSNQNLLLMDQNEKINQQKNQLVSMSQKIQEITTDKIAFFTNITHEFRTPITLIIGPIERAIHLSYNPQVIEQLEIVERNSKSLLSLVNQLLDFRKVESNTIEMSITTNHIVRLIEEIVMPFDAFAGEREITIQKYYRLDTPYFVYDEEWIRKVFVNLLSNAIKFTPNGGRINLYVCNFAGGKRERDRLYICVSDTGTGVPEEEQEKIFDRFYQSATSPKDSIYGQGGTGIGLYLCQRIIKEHGGAVWVRNNPKAGASFRVMLHLQRGEQPQQERPFYVENLSQGLPPQQEREKKDMLTILIVEDNSDMRKYIRSILSKVYHTLEAVNGMEAIKLLAQGTHNIDFIISDVMMPVMDGIEFSRRVKENIATSHLPILMLTAKMSDEMRIESYKIGVDEYLTKPFDEKLLLIRIENILHIRQQHWKQFKFSMDPAVLHIDEESKDKKLLDKVMSVIEQNYKDPEFEVAQFADKIGMSKTSLNIKLQELTGQSIARFIRTYRLNVAQKLIVANQATKNMNISEIAYEVGFNDPKYFAKVFNNHFGILPSSLIEK